ncbi:L-threonylcarbamoyladenylate synthase [Fischerella thermalis]|jgi:tRNA threonylcarbamoyl adenosine modification protein (Sua5/YciO/YrdC/YwlC family)|uniref:Sua5/YciO/YrdC/YwlC family protein n=1 Tax=Fischerella thermalis JSC-11 TaxID=741277 RepID=G6FP53_9CYAN|nr:L-threonylcarbamoyladenylate synthase [Fischerella thermalis]PMB03114.1 threonylcarbamoyl-AMP synthase [Fischerella thermalis CCMEE 5328]PMB03829.1 threonylcarbamoyl-AMP synthase [Fischerella thermalis CCMEE 5273]EHC18653.1 Sua5/YciO/YrdC/YwlC family protein [Fischerella thermalis JSC-11]MBF1990926.1 threonylcarbamoyl-AMP synthase [Fischerella thermalis M58_A2018_009]MBF2062606.1 threonylcarbamoyl-AMP synthase [Fischerella thermalis M66_A2018_004]
MAKIFSVHPDNPQPRRIEEIKTALSDGAVMLYPTDTVYAIGCDLNAKSAVERVRKIKQLANDKPLTFLCSSLSNVATYANVSDTAYRIMKHLIPGPYTFLLPATKLVPRLVQSPKRKTTGIRVPNHKVCLELLSALGNPIISTSAHLPPDETNNGILGVEEEQILSRVELFDRLEGLVDVIVDTGEEPSYEVSTILDLTGEEPMMIRQGLGWERAAAWV